MIFVGARNFLIFLACAIGPSLWLAEVSPRAWLKDYTSKLAAFEADPEGFDVIVIGTSRVQRGFVPEVFDEAMALEGVEVRSFNFGLPGSSEHEWNVLLPEILSRATRPLKWVIVELHPARENYFNWQVTNRLTHWHNPAETLRVLRSIELAEISEQERREHTRAHLKFGLIHNFNLGLGPRLIAQALDRERPLKQQPHRGWAPFDGARETVEKRRKSFLGMMSTFESRAHRARKDKLIPTRKFVLSELVQLKVQMIESVGAQAVFVALMPLTTAPSFEDAGDLTVLEYNNPRRLPGYFVFENFHDAQHLSTSGAKKLSRRLARDI